MREEPPLCRVRVFLLRLRASSGKVNTRELRYVGWGVGERVRIDKRWRIVIPAKFRRSLRVGEELIVEERGAEIVLRKAPREDLLKRFGEIKLFADEKLVERSAERGKHRYGGRKV